MVTARAHGVPRSHVRSTGGLNPGAGALAVSQVVSPTSSPVAVIAAELAAQCMVLNRILLERQDSQAEQIGAIRELEKLSQMRLPASPCRGRTVPCVSTVSEGPQFFDLTAADSLVNLSCDIEASYEHLAESWCKGHGVGDDESDLDFFQTALASPTNADRLTRITKYFCMDGDAVSEEDIRDVSAYRLASSRHARASPTRNSPRRTGLIKSWADMTARERLKSFRLEADALTNVALDLVADSARTAGRRKQEAAGSPTFATPEKVVQQPMARAHMAAPAQARLKLDVMEASAQEISDAKIAPLSFVEPSPSATLPTTPQSEPQGSPKLGVLEAPAQETSEAEEPSLSFVKPSSSATFPTASQGQSQAKVNAVFCRRVHSVPAASKPAPQQEDAVAIKTGGGSASWRGRSRGAEELAQKLDKRLSMLEAINTSPSVTTHGPSKRGGGAGELVTSLTSQRPRSASNSRCSEELAQKLSRRLSQVEPDKAG